MKTLYLLCNALIINIIQIVIFLSMETSVNQQISKECADNLDGALRYLGYALTQLEGDGNCAEECVKLWKIFQSVVAFKAKYEFLNRLGVWSYLCSSES